MENIRRYFPTLSEKQLSQIEKLVPLYTEWNEKINVISRKDIGNLLEHHVQHSLAIKKVMNFKAGASVLDLGTGGGFPGIPLAIAFPKTNFTLIDGTSKKLKVVQAVVDELELENVTVLHKRAEELKQRFDFVVTRAVAKLDKLMLWSQPLLKYKQIHGVPNGVFALKGGRIKEEIKLLQKGAYTEVTHLTSMFAEQYFEEKCIVYVQG